MKTTVTELRTMAKRYNIPGRSKMRKQELLDALKQHANQQVGYKRKKAPMQMVKFPGTNAIMSLGHAVKMRLTTDKPYTLITHTVSNTVHKEDWVDRHMILVKGNLLPDTNDQYISINAARKDAEEYFRVLRAEVVNEAKYGKPMPSKAAIETFYTLMGRDRELLTQLNKMRVVSPKDLDFPKYAVLDDKGNMMTYNRNTAWAEALRKWDWNLAGVKHKTRQVMGINISRNNIFGPLNKDEKRVNVSYSPKRYAPTWTFTSTRSLVSYVHVFKTITEDLTNIEVKMVCEYLARTSGLKQVKAFMTDAPQHNTTVRNTWYKGQIKEIKHLTAMMGTKHWNQDKRELISNRDGLKHNGHLAGYDYGRAARTLASLVEAQKPLRDERQEIKARLDKATEIFGDNLWCHHFDHIHYTIGNINHIHGEVDETCDDLKAHSASLDHGKNLKASYHEEMDRYENAVKRCVEQYERDTELLASCIKRGNWDALMADLDACLEALQPEDEYPILTELVWEHLSVKRADNTPDATDDIWDNALGVYDGQDAQADIDDSDEEANMAYVTDAEAVDAFLLLQ